MTWLPGDIALEGRKHGGCAEASGGSVSPNVGL